MKKIFLLGIIAAAMMTSCSEKVETSYSTDEVRLGSISTSITATGTIEPVTSVEVGTQVSGIINKIYVDYNSVVKKGQVIAELDKTNLTSELASAQSNLSNAQASLTYQKANYTRYKNLFDKGLISAKDYESAKLSYEQARQQVKVQQENVAKAKTNLGYATITAPIDGIVLSKEVEEGQTVASQMTTPTLFIIAKNLVDMRVIADIDEADIGGVKEGQRVTFTVDAFPDDVFNGKVTQVRQEATTESNVVTYEVVISAENDNLKLKPGLTANVTIYTQEKNNVLVVSAKALRFTPNDALLSKDQKIEDVKAKDKLWTLENNVFKAHAVGVGITNGTLTEITGGIKQGEKVLIDFSQGGSAGQDAQAGDDDASNPFMPGPPNKNKNKDKK